MEKFIEFRIFLIWNGNHYCKTQAVILNFLKVVPTKDSYIDVDILNNILKSKTLDEYNDIEIGNLIIDRSADPDYGILNTDKIFKIYIEEGIVKFKYEEAIYQPGEYVCINGGKIEVEECLRNNEENKILISGKIYIDLYSWEKNSDNVLQSKDLITIIEDDFKIEIDKNGKVIFGETDGFIQGTIEYSSENATVRWPSFTCFRYYNYAHEKTSSRAALCLK